MMTAQATSKCGGSQSLQSLCHPAISNLHRFALFRDLRCIWTTPFWKMITRSFFALRIDPVVCPLCGVSYGIRTGGAMPRTRQFALMLLCGTVTIAGWCAARLDGFEWSAIENTATPIWNRGAARGATISSADAGPVGALLAHAIPSVAAVTTSHRKLPESHPRPSLPPMW
jgi:hypothetical protein